MGFPKNSNIIGSSPLGDIPTIFFNTSAVAWRPIQLLVHVDNLQREFPCWLFFSRNKMVLVFAPAVGATHATISLYDLSFK